MFKRRKADQDGGDKGHEVFLGLRGQLLTTDPAELQLSPSQRLPRRTSTGYSQSPRHHCRGLALFGSMRSHSIR